MRPCFDFPVAKSSPFYTATQALQQQTWQNVEISLWLSASTNQINRGIRKMFGRPTKITPITNIVKISKQLIKRDDVAGFPCLSFFFD